MRRFFKKNQILTIPNLLSVVRLALIPVIVWLYSVEKNYYGAIGVIALSAATDIVDGWIARHFNMISDFGKALDPLADKLTQAALLLCLLSKYELMWGLTIVFGVCEITKFTLGIIIAKKHNEVNGAKWYGKHRNHLRNDDGVNSVPSDERYSCEYFDAVLRSGYDSYTRTLLHIFRQDTV